MTHQTKEENQVKTPGEICYDRWVSSAPALANLWKVKTQNDKAAWEAAAAAVLASQWRRRETDPPKEVDVLFLHGDYWMPRPPLPAPPEPTPEERERAEFDEWFLKHGLQATLDWSDAGESIQKLMLLGWQAARKPKEESK